MLVSVDPQQDYEFTEDWTSCHVDAWRPVLESLRPRRILEIGCYEGRTTAFLIRTCARYGAHIVCVDTWKGSVDLPPERMDGVKGRFDRNVARACASADAPVTVQIEQSPSAVALVQMLADKVAPFDFIYVDGSHTAPDVLTDAVLAFRLLRVGGLMMFDDYLWCMESADKRDPLNMPKPAIDAFVNIFMRKSTFCPLGMQFVISKVED